ncbi:hypothetical protein ACFWGI_16955 [Streptomyces niveus]|uniref:hypothetical protein n=1 Tax=Streptomyces niveus TaxID=193462 RepID=UPI0036479174
MEEHELLVWIVATRPRSTSEPGTRTRFSSATAHTWSTEIDGGLHQIGPVSYVTGEWEADYRKRIRKEPARTAVNDLHDEVRQAAAEQGRIPSRTCCGNASRAWPMPKPSST